MEYMELEVYSQSIDRGVVRMPSQRLPGFVLQGETLSSLLRLARLTCEKLSDTTDTELIDASRELMESIQKLVSHYETTSPQAQYSSTLFHGSITNGPKLSSYMIFIV